MNRRRLLRELEVERYATTGPPSVPLLTPEIERRRRILLGEELPEDFMPPPERQDIASDVVRMTALRWQPNQIAAVLRVPESAVVSALRRRPR